MAAHARLHSLSWLVQHQQSVAEELNQRLNASISGSRNAASAAQTSICAPLPPESAEVHLQAALASLAACAAALSERADPGDTEGQLSSLMRRVSGALDACASLAQAAPLAQAAAERAPQRRDDAATMLAAAQCRAEKLSAENAGLRATVKRLREKGEREKRDFAERTSVSDLRERQLAVAADAARAVTERHPTIKRAWVPSLAAAPPPLQRVSPQVASPVRQMRPSPYHDPVPSPPVLPGQQTPSLHTPPPPPPPPSSLQPTAAAAPSAPTQTRQAYPDDPSGGGPPPPQVGGAPPPAVQQQHAAAAATRRHADTRAAAPSARTAASQRLHRVNLWPPAG